jgi:hypothetical protein
MSELVNVDTGLPAPQPSASAPAASSPVDTANPNPAPSADDQLGKVWDRLMRDNGAERGEGGKFASPTGSEQPKDGGQAEPAAAAPGATAPAATAAPAHLTQALKAQWDKMPEEARAEVARLTTEWDRKFGEQGKQLGQVKPIADKLTAAVQQFPEFKGMTPDQLAEGALQLAAVQSALHKNPLQTIVEIAQHYGVLPHLAAALQGTDVKPGDSADSGRIIAGLERKIANLEADLKKVGSPDTVRSEISRTMLEKDTETLVKDFAKGKDFYGDVEARLPDFISIVLANGGQGRPPADVLSDAYDMAINAIPEVRAKVRAAEARATAAVPDPKRTEAARKAASINVKPSANGKDRALTDEEAMGAAYDRVMASH